MISRKRILALGTLVILILMLTPIPVLAEELVGKIFIIANEGTLREEQPSITYNSQRNHYLVVWSNNRPGNDDIRAQKVAVDGSLIGGPFYISGGPDHDRWKPDVTYDRVQDQYLVVWEDYNNKSPATGYSICARRVSGTGLVLDSNDIFITGPGSNLYTPSEPAVAFSDAFNRYLVVWHEVFHPTGSHTIYSQVVRPNGTLDGTPQPISTSIKIHSAPDVAYNPREDRYMVAWQEYNSGTNVYDVKGHQVVGNGNLYGSTITYDNSGIAHEGPVVAALPNNSNDITYMIAWIIKKSNGWEGYSNAFTDRFGTKLGFGSTSSSYQSFSHIALAANPNSETFLYAYQLDQGIMDKSIFLYQEDHNAFYKDSFEISGPANDFPAIAAGPTGDYLVAWQGQPLSITHTNIYGQVIGNRSYLPLMKK